jgi:hypothetical protein
LPEFWAKLADSDLNLDHPVWVEDPEFDVRHLNRIALPAPGGREELAEVCGRIASVPLDRSKPLSEMWVIEGLDGSAAGDGGRCPRRSKSRGAHRHRRAPSQQRARRAAAAILTRPPIDLRREKRVSGDLCVGERIFNDDQVFARQLQPHGVVCCD